MWIGRGNIDIPSLDSDVISWLQHKWHNAQPLLLEKIFPTHVEKYGTKETTLFLNKKIRNAMETFIPIGNYLVKIQERLKMPL